MIAMQASVFSTTCFSAGSIRASRATRPSCRHIVRTTRSGPTRLNSTPDIHTSAKSLGSLGLGSQPAILSHRRAHNGPTSPHKARGTATRRANLLICAASGAKLLAPDGISVGAYFA
eukprot:9398470-Pyramimonas_sp.AAC.1